MTDAVICEPLRTPVSRYGGALRDVPVAELGATVVRALLQRTGLRPEHVDDLVLGHCYPTMEAPALGRVVALDAGLGVGVRAGSWTAGARPGLQAVPQAAMAVCSGASELVIADGAESMSNAPFSSTTMPWGVHGEGVALHDGPARGRITAGGRNYPVPGGMLVTMCIGGGQGLAAVFERVA